MNQQNEYCEVEITRERFEKLSEPLVFQTLEVVQKMLEEAEEKGITMDAIVLSGGGSKVPMIRTSLEKLVEDKYPIIMHRPSEAVSFGASRFAGASRFGYGDGVAHKEDTKEESENNDIRFNRLYVGRGAGEKSACVRWRPAGRHIKDVRGI